MALGDGTTWNETVPDNSTVANQIDDYMRDMLAAVRSRMAIEHVWASAQTGTNEAGMHKYVTFQVQTAAPTISSGLGQVGALYIQTNSATGHSLMYERSGGTAITIIDGTDNLIPATLVNTGVIPAGTVIQVVNTMVGTVASGSTAIPFDDSIPQITEGDEYMSLAITPTSSTSKLKIDVVCAGGQSAGGRITSALFVGTTADALAAIGGYEEVDVLLPLAYTHYMVSGTTGSMTFRVRNGTSSGTYTFNGIGGAQEYGGKMASSITISEVKV